MDKQQAFEEFLEEMFLNFKEVRGIPITKNNFDYMFSDWLGRIDGEDYIKLAGLYGKSQFLAGKGEILGKIKL